MNLKAKMNLIDNQKIKNSLTFENQISQSLNCKQKQTHDKKFDTVLNSTLLIPAIKNI